MSVYICSAFRKRRLRFLRALLLAAASAATVAASEVAIAGVSQGTVPVAVPTVAPAPAAAPAAVAVAALVAAPASAGTPTAPRISGAVTVLDDTGQRVTLAAHPTRIVSLAPGATEMLFAAGAGNLVIATVEYSDEPPAARKVPRIGDVVAIDMERLVALRPEVAVVWPGGGNPAQIEEIRRMGIPLYRQQVNALADLAGSLRRLGSLAGTSAVAELAARHIEARLASLGHSYANTRHPTVLLEVGNHPVYTIGGTHLMSDALKLCGARNVFGDLGDQGPAVDIEAVVARNPDIIVAAAPPGDGLEWLSEWKRFPSLHAVRAGNLIAFEDPRLVRLGPSIVDATEALCKVLAAAH